MAVKNIPLDLIQSNPWQTRGDSGDILHIDSLAESIAVNELLQIPSGRQIDAEGHVQIAFGHNRLCAYELLRGGKLSSGRVVDGSKYAEFPVNLLDLSDEQMAVMAFEENEKRRDLNPVERARAVQKMITVFEWDQSAVAEKLSLDRSTISNMLRMLKLPEEVLSSVEEGRLSQRLAMALLPRYELTDVEWAIVISKDPGADDFISMARNGMLTNSDKIREHVDELVALSRPDEPQAELAPTTPTAPGWIKNDEQPDNESLTEPGEETCPISGLPESIFRNDGDPEPDLEAIDKAVKDASPAKKKPEPPSKKPVTPEHKPTPEPKQVSAVMKGETLITIKILSNGSAFIGTQKFGALLPTFSTTAKFHVEDLPGILKGMGIE